MRPYTVDYHKDKTPLAGGKTRHVACISCDDLLNGSIQVVYGKGGGGGGRGGRGGRGGKGGGGGRTKDPAITAHQEKMSFKDF